MPSEEEGLGPRPFGQAHSLEGGHVVGLLVNVDNVRLKTPDVLPQAGVEVQVKVPVEQHGLDNEVIAFCIYPFQGHRPPLVAPIGRHDDRQFHVIEAGQFFQFFLISAYDAGLGNH